MNKLKLTGKELLLSFLYSPGKTDNINERIIGRTKITKMMFIFEKEIKKDFFNDTTPPLFYDFEAYYYGPFSRTLLDDITILQSLSFIQSRDTDIPLSSTEKAEDNYTTETFDDSSNNQNEIKFDTEEKYEKEFILTEIGIQYVESKIWIHFSDNQKEILKRFKQKINALSLNNILDYVYNKYKDYTTNSLIKDLYIKE